MRGCWGHLSTMLCGGKPPFQQPSPFQLIGGAEPHEPDLQPGRSVTCSLRSQRKTWGFETVVHPEEKHKAAKETFTLDSLYKTTRIFWMFRARLMVLTQISAGSHSFKCSDDRIMVTFFVSHISVVPNFFFWIISCKISLIEIFILAIINILTKCCEAELWMNHEMSLKL